MRLQVKINFKKAFYFRCNFSTNWYTIRLMYVSEQHYFTKKSFTLIEMLIVIVIIGILAAALVPRLRDVQWRARDTKRKVDLKTIYNANEIYILDNGTYAPVVWVRSYYSTGSQPWIPGLSWILTSIPTDPINNGIYTITGNYVYRYGNLLSWSINSYDLTTVLENRNDPQNCLSLNRTYFYPTTWCQFAAAAYNYPHLWYSYEYSPHSGRF